MAPRCLFPPRDKDEKPNKKTMSFARLFVDEIEDYFKLNFVQCYKFEKFFDSNVFDKLVADEVLPLEVARKATTDDAAFEIMDRLFIEENSDSSMDLWAKIHLPDAPETSSFTIFSEKLLIPSDTFLLLDRFASTLDIGENFLEVMCPGSKYSKLRAAVSCGPQLKPKKARRFLRELPLLEGDGYEWYWRLIEACTQDAYNMHHLLSHIPNWQTGLAAYRLAVSCSSHSFDPCQRVLVPGVSCRPPAEFEPYRDEMTVAGTAEMPVLREYQKELVERTDRGENTIVCAPTGSGKTVVGAHVALHHLKSHAKQGKAARVVMIVPKVFLVEQQAALFKKYTKKEYYVAKLSGDMNEAGEAQLIKFLSGDIVVLTPQILVNMLREDCERARLYIADITLLLLDECHHADKKNPYNLIMQAVKDDIHGGPQVVGLTASLGVGDSGSAGAIVVHEQAFNHIVRTCLRMAARSITTVMRHKAELASHVQLPEDVLRRVLPLPLGDRHFHSHLLTAISFVERHLYAEFDLLMREQPSGIDPNKLVRFPPIEKMEEYIAAYVNVDTELRKLKDGERKWRLKRGIDFVKMYHNAVLLNDLLPASYALEQLTSDVAELDSAPVGRQCVFLNHFNQHRHGFGEKVERENDKEILHELRKELANQFRADSNSRVLIFCLKRETVQLLVKYLNETRIDGMGRAEVLTSTNAAAVKNGQSNSEQRAVIEAFTNGACKVIVATSVAEEGLDVQACNLIIKYNIAGNVISRVQQRGRARARNSRSVLLALDEKVYTKEQKNKMAEDVMMRTVAKIYDMGDAEFARAIEKERIIQVKQEKADEKEAEKRNTNKYRELSLWCEKCSQPLCSSTSIRVVSNNYVSIDPKLWDRVRVQAKKEVVNSVPSMGIVSCKCGRVLGQVVKIKEQFVPTIKAEAILFKAPDGKDLPKMKKWKSVTSNHLDIREGTTMELTTMNRGLQSSNQTLCNALERLSIL